MFRSILSSNKYIVVPTQKAPSQIHADNSSFKGSLKDLVYVSTLQSAAFLEKKDFENQKHQHTAELFAFGYYNGRNIGASRHINGESYQIKGAGRNQLAIREDYQHAWGGLEYNVGFREYILANILRGLDEEAVVNYFAFGTYQFESETKSAFILREKFLPRLAQLSPCNLSENEINNIKDALALVEIHSLHHLINTHIKNFIKLMILGFYHTSYNFENITLDAKILDAASLICRHDKNVFSIPEFEYEGESKSYFYFLQRVLVRSVIPVGEKIFGESFKEDCLIDVFTTSVHELEISPETADNLIKLFNGTQVNLKPIHKTSTITELYLSHSSGLISSDIEMSIQKEYLKWSKIQPHSEEDSKVVLENLIASYK